MLPTITYRKDQDILKTDLILAFGRFDCVGALGVVGAQHLLLVPDPLLEIVAFTIKAEKADRIFEKRVASASQFLQFFVRIVDLLHPLLYVLAFIQGILRIRSFICKDNACLAWVLSLPL